MTNTEIAVKTRKAIGLFLDLDLLAKVDAAAKAKNISRAAFIRALLVESV